MKTTTPIPAYPVFEYLLVLNPHEDLRHRIRDVQKTFGETYETAASLSGRPQITLAIFKQYAMAEERIVNHLRTIAMAAKPFKVELKDFGSFPAHTIFINVTSKVPLQHLVKTVRAETGRLMKMNDDNKPHFMLEPFIAIARKLLPWQFEKGWLEYSHKHFTGRFIADAMLLLKRKQGELRYEVAARFEFQNLPVATTQGALFA